MANLEDYKVDIDMSMPHRIAAFLDWAARIAPSRPISFERLTKIVMLMPKAHMNESDQRVESIRGAVRRAKPILMDTYRRGLVPHPGFGVRATTDSEDIARNQYQQDARRITSAIRSADRTRSLIRPNEIRDRDLKARVNNINSAVRVLVSPDVIDKLLPEAKKEG